MFASSSHLLENNKPFPMLGKVLYIMLKILLRPSAVRVVLNKLTVNKSQGADGTSTLV